MCSCHACVKNFKEWCHLKETRPCSQSARHPSTNSHRLQAPRPPDRRLWLSLTWTSSQANLLLTTLQFRVIFLAESGLWVTDTVGGSENIDRLTSLLSSFIVMISVWSIWLGRSHSQVTTRRRDWATGRALNPLSASHLRSQLLIFICIKISFSLTTAIPIKLKPVTSSQLPGDHWNDKLGALDSFVMINHD